MAGWDGFEDYWPGYVALVLLLGVYLFWFYAIFIRIFLSNISNFLKTGQALETGDIVSAGIIKSDATGEVLPGKPRKTAITVEFPNFSHTMIQQDFHFTDTKPEQGRYGEGKSVQLKVIRGGPDGGRAVLAGGTVSFSWKFWAIFLLGLCLYIGGGYYLGISVIEHHEGSFTSILEAAATGDVFGLLAGLGITALVLLIVFRSFAGAFDRQGMSRLKWYGQKATATIERLERTGVSVNDQPQIAFHYSFRASNGQSYSGVDKKIVDILEISKVHELKEKEVLYLQEDPSQSLFVEHVGSGSGNVLLLKLVLYSVALVFSAVLAGNILSGLLA